MLDLSGCRRLLNLPYELGKLTGLEALHLRCAPRMFHIDCAEVP